MRMWVQYPGLAQWIKNLALLQAVTQVEDMAQIRKLLWLWYRLVAMAPIQPLAWEIPCAMGVTLKDKTKQNKKKQKRTSQI